MVGQPQLGEGRSRWRRRPIRRSTAPPMLRSRRRRRASLTSRHTTRPARSATRWRWSTVTLTRPATADVVGWAELPTAGNELHHFGWNACSSALCHEGHDGDARAPLSGRARDPLVAHHTSSTPSPTPASRRSSGRSRPRSSPSKAGYSRPHTVHCGPGRHLHVERSARAGNGDGPGGVALLDHDTFEVTGAWETDRGDQYFAYDVWWHLNEDVR